MYYLITGGAGFIGSHIVEELLRRGENVRVLDNFSTGKRENIVNILRNLPSQKANLDVIEGDIRSYHTVREAVDGIDFILHQAALPSVPRSVKDPITTNEVNVVGTLNILEAARDSGVKRVVYASSSSVYGNSSVIPKSEDMKPAPLSPYAVSKLAGEEYCKVFTAIYELETVVLRYFNVFGPRQDPTSQYSAVIPKFTEAISNDKPPLIYGDGEQSRDFTYVLNVAKANLLAVKIPGIAGEVFNIACGKRITVNALFETIGEFLNSDVRPIYNEPRQGDIRHSQASIEKAIKILHYAPEISFTEGIKKLSTS